MTPARSAMAAAISTWLMIPLGGCTNSPDTAGEATLTVEELMKPETCEECHENHVREWSSSMHAYAGQDPIFLAMNRRGQEETDGQLGNFCVQCHAPLAVLEKRTTDGLNLDEVEEELKGVTCYFCHNVESIKEEHDNLLGLPANNPLELARDTIMRGGLDNAKRPPTHGVEYSPMHDGDSPESSKLCGSCHDIVTPAGVHLERTYAEWQSTLLADSTSCVGCHMDSYSGVAANTDKVEVALRPGGLHRHLMPGVDTALTDFPDKDIQLKAIECALRNAVIMQLRVAPDRTAEIWLETEVGHGWPSGATQDRRAWLELRAFDKNGQEVYSRGVIPDDQPVPHRDEPGGPVQLRDWVFDAEGNEAHMFWDVAASDAYPLGYDAGSLIPRTKDGPPHTLILEPSFPMSATRVEAQVHIRAIGHDLIDDLVASGHLGAEEGRTFKTEIKTHTLASSLTVWREERDGSNWVKDSEPTDLTCPDDWRCLLYPDDPGCSP